VDSDKPFKVYEHRRERRSITNILRPHLAEELWERAPHRKKFGNVWASCKDGKGYFGDVKYRDCPYVSKSFGVWLTMCDEQGHYCSKYYDKLMRK
jgi:hypothetical protein